MHGDEYDKREEKILLQNHQIIFPVFVTFYPPKSDENRKNSLVRRLRNWVATAATPAMTTAHSAVKKALLHHLPKKEKIEKHQHLSAWSRKNWPEYALRQWKALLERRRNITD